MLTRSRSSRSAPAFGSPHQPQHAPQFVPQHIPTGPSGQPLTPMSGALVAPGGFSGMPAQRQPQPQLHHPSPQSTVLPDFQSHFDAERAFMGMLGKIGVTPAWTWEQTMRETITEPYYKALKTLAERKTAFERFVAERKQADKDERDRSLERCRKDFFKALDRLGGGPERDDGIKSWWGWEKGEKELSRRMGEAWKAPRNDEERRTLFEEYIAALKTKESVRPPPCKRCPSEALTTVPTDKAQGAPHEEHGQGRGHSPGALARHRGQRALARGAVDHLQHPRVGTGL